MTTFATSLLTAALVTGLALAPTAAARPATTAPGARTYVRVVITERSMSVGEASSAPRGDWIVFHVVNRSSSTAKLSFLGRASRSIPPSKRGVLAILVLRRGAFPLVTSLSRHRSLRRTFIVY